MDDTLTNLIPDERQKEASRRYVGRLFTVGIMLAVALVLIAGALLIPTYVFLSQSAKEKEERIATIENSLSAADEEALSLRVSALSSQATVLLKLENAVSLSAVLRSILEVPRPGIKLHGFNYAQPEGSSPIALTVSGSALTRDALRRYQLALQSSPNVLSADLPVSAYAKDSNISFTIALTLAP